MVRKVRKKDIEAIKDQLKEERKQRKKEIQVDVTFQNSLAALCLTNELHCLTIYKLIKVKHIDQMLRTMRESTIKDYNLHIPTLEKLEETPGLKRELEERLEKDYGRVIKIPI